MSIALSDTEQKKLDACRKGAMETLRTAISHLPSRVKDLDFGEGKELASKLLTESTESQVNEAIDIVAEVLGLKPLSGRVRKVYQMILCELPADLLSMATRRICRNHRFPKMPTPADFIMQVKVELDERQRLPRLFSIAEDRISHFKQS